MQKKMKLQATPATLKQKNPEAEAEAQSTEEKVPELTAEEFEAQCELRNELIRRRFYLFGTLSEEAGEVVQVIGKILRFGEKDSHPKTENIPNIQLLHSELNDLFAVALELGWKPDTVAVKEKQAKVEKYWQYAKAGGSRGNNS